MLTGHNTHTSRFEEAQKFLDAYDSFVVAAIVNSIAVKFYPDSEMRYPGLAESIKQWELVDRPHYLVPLASVTESAKSGGLTIGLDGPGKLGCHGGYEL
jgi:hypothetical protein